MTNSTTCLIQAIGSIPTILIASLGLLFLWTSNGIPTSFQQFKANALIHLMLELFWVFSKKSSRLRTNQSHINIYCATSTFDSFKYDWTCPLLVVQVVLKFIPSTNHGTHFKHSIRPNLWIWFMSERLLKCLLLRALYIF